MFIQNVIFLLWKWIKYRRMSFIFIKTEKESRKFLNKFNEFCQILLTNFGQQHKINKNEMQNTIPAEWLKGLNSNLIKCFRWWKALIKHIWTFYSGENWKQFFLLLFFAFFLLLANINVIRSRFLAHICWLQFKGEKVYWKLRSKCGELCKL